jgi:hypothetical protein
VSTNVDSPDADTGPGGDLSQFAFGLI